MQKNKNTDILLTYYDITIRQRDIDCLEPKRWLNDICIAFYYQYLKENNQNDAIYLMDPAVVALLNYEEDPAMIFYGLDLMQFEFILIPINDNSDKMNALGGSHWSLLTYLCREDVFIYYDSMKKRSNNLENAKKVAKKLRPLINDTPTSKVLDNLLINSDTPQQKNGYDCGVYVLGFTENLLKYLLKKENVLNNTKMSATITEEYIDNLRGKIRDLILNSIKKN